MYTCMYISCKWSTDQHTQASKTRAQHSSMHYTTRCCWPLVHAAGLTESERTTVVLDESRVLFLAEPSTHACCWLRCSLLPSVLESIDGALPLSCRASRATLVNQLSTFASSLQARFVPCPSDGVTAPCCFAVLDQAVSQRVKTAFWGCLVLTKIFCARPLPYAAASACSWKDRMLLCAREREVQVSQHRPES
jgi:hypothetical protein